MYKVFFFFVVRGKEKLVFINNICIGMIVIKVYR